MAKRAWRRWTPLKEWWYRNVQCRLFPRQRWLKIPRVFHDIDHIMETVAVQSLINYWENDDGERILRINAETACDWHPDELANRVTIYQEMKSAYEFFKHNEYDWRDDFDELGKEQAIHVDNIWRHRHGLWS